MVSIGWDVSVYVQTININLNYMSVYSWMHGTWETLSYSKNSIRLGITCDQNSFPNKSKHYSWLCVVKGLLGFFIIHLKSMALVTK